MESSMELLALFGQNITVMENAANAAADVTIKKTVININGSEEFERTSAGDGVHLKFHFFRTVSYKSLVPVLISSRSLRLPA